MQTVSLKFESASVICLMIASSFAAVPTSSQLQAVITAANASVPGNYVTLKTLATELHNAAVAYTAIANSNRNDGTLAKWDSIIRASRAQMIAPPSNASLQKVYNRAVNDGYQGSFSDFTKYLPPDETTRKKAYSVGTSLGLYKVMINAAKGYQAAADAINNSLLASRHPARLVYTSYHVLLVNLPAPTCSAIDWGLTFLLVTSAFTPQMILAPVWGVANIIWFGVARSEAGCA